MADKKIKNGIRKTLGSNMGVIADTGCLLCFISTKHLPNGCYETPSINLFLNYTCDMGYFFQKDYSGSGTMHLRQTRLQQTRAVSDKQVNGEVRGYTMNK